MDNQQIKEMLEKQLQLLSERSKACESDGELSRISDSMLEISRLLISQRPDRVPYRPLK